MAEKTRDWYAKNKDKAAGDGAEAQKPEGRGERHTRERSEAHARHAAARDALHKQHEDEWASLAERQAGEASLPEQVEPGPDASPAAAAAATSSTEA